MSAIEIIDNLETLNYKFEEEKNTEYKLDDYQKVSNKYREIVNKIFKSPSDEEVDNYYYRNNYTAAYLKAFQETNKEILNYIIEKYEINREFINEFYEDLQVCSETFNITYDYIYLFIKDSFGDLLINKYTMAKFTVLSRIVENILRTNFEWYKSTVNCGIIYMDEILGFSIFKYDFSELTNIIDFLFIRHFNRYNPFRKYYVARRIEQMTNYDFADLTQYMDSLHDYESCYENSFYTFYSENSDPWIQYNEYYELNEEEATERFIEDEYLDSYRSIKTIRNEPIFYECNIIDILSDDESDNEDELELEDEEEEGY